MRCAPNSKKQRYCCLCKSDHIILQALCHNDEFICGNGDELGPEVFKSACSVTPMWFYIVSRVWDSFIATVSMRRLCIPATMRKRRWKPRSAFFLCVAPSNTVLDAHVKFSIRISRTRWSFMEIVACKDFWTVHSVTPVKAKLNLASWAVRSDTDAWRKRCHFFTKRVHIFRFIVRHPLSFVLNILAAPCL